MLLSVEIFNYKTHKHSLVTFKNFTAVKGANDAGKTNIWRALRAVLTNQAIPVKHIRHGESEALIIVTFFDGRKILRKRSKTVNCVKMLNADGSLYAEGDVVKDMVDTVRAFTGFGPVVVDANGDTEDLQFISSRGDKYWGLTESPKTLLQRLTKLGSSHGIETAKSALESELRAIAAKRKLLEQDRGAKQAAADKARAVPRSRLQTEVAAVNAEAARIDRDVQRLLGMRKLTAARPKPAQPPADYRERFAKLLRGAEQINAGVDKLHTMLGLLGNLSDAKRKVSDAYEEVNTLTIHLGHLRETQPEETCAMCGRPL